MAMAKALKTMTTISPKYRMLSGMRLSGPNSIQSQVIRSGWVLSGTLRMTAMVSKNEPTWIGISLCCSQGET